MFMGFFFVRGWITPDVKAQIFSSSRMVPLAAPAPRIDRAFSQTPFGLNAIKVPKPPFQESSNQISVTRTTEPRTPESIRKLSSQNQYKTGPKNPSRNNLETEAPVPRLRTQKR